MFARLSIMWIITGKCQGCLRQSANDQGAQEEKKTQCVYSVHVSVHGNKHTQANLT